MSIRRGTLVTNTALAALLLGGVVLAYVQLGPEEAAGESGARTVRAGRGTVVAAVSASGSVESAKSRSLSFGMSGTVEHVYVKPGDEVKKGQLLAKLDDDAAQEDLAAALASYQSARADGTATARLNAAYVKARNAYREAARAVAGTVLKAPFSGTVTAVNGSAGGSSGQGQGGSGFIELADTGRLRVVGSFTESDVGRLKTGQEAVVTFAALPGVTATGEVTQIQPVAATTENVVQYPVTISFGQVPEQVRLGQTATVQIEVGRAEDVVTVPTTAISAVGGQDTVTVLKDGRQTRVRVEVGVRGAATAEIVSGVREGDLIVPPATTGTGTDDQRRGGFNGFGGERPGGGPPGGGR